MRKGLKRCVWGCVFVSAFVCPSCVIPRSRGCSVSSAAPPLTEDSPTLPHPLICASLKLLLHNSATTTTKKSQDSQPLPVHLEILLFLSHFFISAALSYVSTLPFTHSKMSDPLFLLSLSLHVLLPPNQSHMLETEAERSDNRHNCVECGVCVCVCATVLEPTAACVSARKCGKARLRLFLTGTQSRALNPAHVVQVS